LMVITLMGGKKGKKEEDANWPSLFRSAKSDFSLKGKNRCTWTKKKNRRRLKREDVGSSKKKKKIKVRTNGEGADTFDFQWRPEERKKRKKKASSHIAYRPINSLKKRGRTLQRLRRPNLWSRWEKEKKKKKPHLRPARRKRERRKTRQSAMISYPYTRMRGRRKSSSPYC